MTHPRATHWFFLLALLVAGAHAGGVRYYEPEPGPYHPLDNEVVPQNILKMERPALLTSQSKFVRDTTIIDFEKRQIAFMKIADYGIVVWQYRYYELDDYLADRGRFALLNQWFRSHNTSRGVAQERGRKRLSLELRLPEQYYNQAIPPWAQRIVGKEPPKLSIHGYEEIIISYRSYKYNAPADVKQSPGSPSFDQNYNLTVAGSVGKLINIQMGWSKEQGFDAPDPLKAIKIEYKGEGNELEDDIIQEVKLGYTNFEIPSTNLSGYSESREGLFGVNVKSKFGPLMLTTVASHEKGEALKETFHPQQSASNGLTFSEKDFLEYRYVFLDTLYKQAYIASKMGQAPAVAPPPVSRSDVQVWKMVPGNTSLETVRNDISTKYRAVKNRLNREVFKLVKDGYTVEPGGWIRFVDSTIQDIDNDVIGISMKLRYASGDSIVRGDTLTINGPVNGVDSIADLWIIKDKSAEFDSTNAEWDLWWRNVYRLPKFDGDFDVRVGRIPEGDKDTLYRLGTTLFTQILGLTDANGKRNTNTDIFDVDNGALIIPPFANDSTGNEPFRNVELGADNTQALMYRIRKNLTNQERILSKFQFILDGKFTTRTTTFNLGWGVLEKSEKVKADGRDLVRDVDYRIYYESGDLEILSFGAQSANDITVEYQRESLFMPESKSFLGARGEIRLPFISPTSFIGSSVLYQKFNTNSDVPKIGQEPFNKLLLDVNTKLDWDSEWMTKMVDALPLLETEAPSKVTIDIEAAHSVMKRKNKSGRASVDDFESSVRTYPLSTSPRSWAVSSPPSEFLGDPTGLMPTHPPAWRYFWYSPLDPVKQADKEKADNYKTNMFSGIAIDTRKDDNLLEPVLNLTVLPSGPKTKDRYVDPWAGIMYWFPTSSADRTDDRFLEFLVNINAAQAGPTRGRLHVDMGEISENLCIQGGPPNARSDQENPFGLTINDTLNRGLDGIRSLLGDGKTDPDNREFTWMPNASHTGWDPIGPGSGSTALNDLLWDPKDPSGDDYKLYDTRNNGDFTKVNGLEGDYTGKLRLLTSEDINGNSFSTRDAYFRFNIDLDSLQPTSNYRYRLGESNVRTDKGWYHVRIPLSAKAADAVVDPARASFERIYFVRLWWDGFSDTATIDKQRNLMLARMQFVGNQWEEVITRSMVSRMVGTMPPRDTTRRFIQFYRDSVIQTYSIDTNKVAVSGISTEDNAVYAAAMAPNSNSSIDTVGMLGIKRQRESNSNVYKKESALLLKYTNVKPTENALIRRRYSYQALDISAYSQVSVLVRSEDDHRYDGTSFVLRFGTDDSSYYEYRTPVQAGWSKLLWTRPIEIDLADLSYLKEWVLDSLEREKAKTGALPDTSHIVARQQIGNTGAYYGMKCRGGAMPSYNNIRMVLMGIERDETGIGPISGELWINEMQVEGLSDISGSAALASVRTQWADFMTLDATADYRDGNFRQMTESQIAPGASRISGAAHGSWNLDKFTPKDLGIQVPLNLTLTETIERPQLRPNSDISLTGPDREPDKLRDFLPNAETDSKNYEKVATSVGVNTRYSKNRESENPIVRLTADRFSLADLGFKKTANSEKQGSFSTLKADTTRTVTTSLKYDLSPRKTPTWTKWQPFAKVKSVRFPAEVKRYELTYLPKTISFDLVDANYQRRVERNDRMSLGHPVVTKNLGMNHGFRFNYSPISPLLDFGYDVSTRRDLSDAVASDMPRTGADGIIRKRVFELDSTWKGYGYLWGEQSRTQNARLDLKPKFFDWLTNTVHYEAAFTSNENEWQRVSALTLNVRSDFKITSSIRFSSLLQDIAKAAKKAKGLNASMTKMQKGLTTIGFDNVSFDYSANLTTRYANVTDTLLNGTLVKREQFNAYRLGFVSGAGANEAGRGIGDIMLAQWDRDAFGGMGYRANHSGSTVSYAGDALTGHRTWNISTSLRIPDPVSLNFTRLSFGHDYTYNAVPDPTLGDTTIVSPKLGISLTSNILNQIGPVKDNVQDVSLSSGYTFDRKLTYRHPTAVREEDTTQTHTLSPLIRIGGTLKKWPVNISYSHNFSKAETKNTQGKTSSRSHSDEASVGYAFNPSAKKPRELKFFGYSIPLKGELRLDLAFTHSFRAEETWGPPASDPNGDDDWQPSLETRSIGIDPKISYDFTDNVTGNVIYSFAWVNNKTPDSSKETTNVFTLSVRISF